MPRIKGKAFDALLIGAMVFAAIALAASDTPQALAQNGAEGPTQQAGSSNEPATMHNPFQKYASGPGAITFEQMSPEQQEAIMKVAEWHDTTHGYAVLNAWRGASRFGRAYAKKKRAERESGLEGVSDSSLGVQ